MDLELEIAHFHEGDANKDGFHSKKEFYYAIMKEEYENFAEKHGVSVADLEFEAEDLDGDGKISLEEWVAVFFHEDPQTPQYVDGEEVDEDSSAPPSPPSTADANPNNAVSGDKGAMRITGGITMPDGREFFLAEDATWLAAEGFCTDISKRLCSHKELCPSVLKADAIVTEEIREGRWAPMLGKSHHWVELRHCGISKWPDKHTHLGLVACCSDEDAKLAAEMEAKRQAAEKAKAEEEERTREEERREEEVAGAAARQEEAERARQSEEKEGKEEEEEEEESWRLEAAAEQMKREKEAIKAARAAGKAGGEAAAGGAKKEGASDAKQQRREMEEEEGGADSVESGGQAGEEEEEGARRSSAELGSGEEEAVATGGEDGVGEDAPKKKKKKGKGKKKKKAAV